LTHNFGGDGHNRGDVADLDVIADELSGLGEKVRVLERRMAEVERVNARLEDAALTTPRAMQEISSHWDAVYEAMWREEKVDAREKNSPSRGDRRRPAISFVDAASGHTDTGFGDGPARDSESLRTEKRGLAARGSASPP
jgi:hypothetical protein